MRVTSENSPGDTDNRGYVVSHVGLNVDRWWEELKQLDADDQEFFDGLGSNDRSFLLSDSRPAGQFPTDAAARRRFRPDMVVLQETIAHYIQEKFLPEDAKAVIDDVVNAMALSGIDTVSLGVTREDLEERIKATISEGEQKGRVLEQPIQPQRGRQVARQRLDERIRSASKQLLNELKSSVGDSIFRAPFRKLGLRTTLLLASCSSTWKSWNT